jgi:hypothetical protein
MVVRERATRKLRARRFGDGGGHGGTDPEARPSPPGLTVEVALDGMLDERLA